jgi:squalene cyclase
MLHAVPPTNRPEATGARTRDGAAPSAVDRALVSLDGRLCTWRDRCREGITAGYQLGDAPTSATQRWLVEIPDVGPTCEVLLADRLLFDLEPIEREAMLAWVRASQDESGAWLDVHGRPDLSLTAMAWWALAQAGDDRTSDRMVKAVRVVHALGGAQRANFEVRLWLAMAGLIQWSWLPAIPSELFLLPPQIAISPARFSPWARGVLTPYLLIARAPARLHLLDASELLLRRSGETLVAPRLTRPGLAGDLLQAFDRAVKLSRKLPRGPLPQIAQRRALGWLDALQQDHGGWFSTRPTLLSLIALRVMGARTDDPRIRRGLDYLRRARGRVVGSGDRIHVAQGQSAAPLPVTAALLATGLESRDIAPLLRWQLQESGPWQHRADAPAGGWPTEPGARAHLDLDATVAVLETLEGVRTDDPAAAPAWAAARRATAVMLAMQEGTGAFARFERGEADVLMQRLPWTDADLLAYGKPDDGVHVRLAALVLERLAATGLRAEDDRVSRSLDFLIRKSADRNDAMPLGTLCAVARAAGALLPDDHALRRGLEQRIRSRQRDDGSFGSLVDTAHALRALVALGHACVQGQRAVRHLLAAIDGDVDAFTSGRTTSCGGPGLSPDTIDPTAAGRETAVALRRWTALAATVTELRT